MGGAFALFKLMAGGHSGTMSTKPRSQLRRRQGMVTTEAKPRRRKESVRPGAIYDVDPFIVNLADTPEVRYLKLTVKLELENPGCISRTRQPCSSVARHDSCPPDE